MRAFKVSAMVLAVASLAFASCKKDKKNPGGGNNPGEVTKKITRIEENGLTTATFEYNADGTLKKASATVSPGNTTNFAFTYNAQKKVSEFSSDQGYKAKYVYMNGVLDRTENFEDGEKVSESIFTYENGKVKSNTMFTAFPEGNGDIVYRPSYRVVYSYHANGNVKKAETYVLKNGTLQLELEQTAIFIQFDNKKSPFAPLAEFAQILMYQGIQINNPIEEELVDAEAGLIETTMHQYTYDAAGYPTTAKSTVTFGGGAPTVINTKFFY